VSVVTERSGIGWLGSSVGVFATPSLACVAPTAGVGFGGGQLDTSQADAAGSDTSG
jgi:hypothetical protein